MESKDKYVHDLIEIYVQLQFQYLLVCLEK